MGEVLEKAFKFYEKREAIINELNTYRQTIPANELIRIKSQSK